MKYDIYSIYMPVKQNPYAHRLLLKNISNAISLGYRTIRIDFSRALNAYPNGMIPIIATIDYYKSKGIEFKITFPNDDRIRELFFKSNWSHLLLPERYEPQNTKYYKHLSARRFRTYSEQQELVNEFMSTVICNMDLKNDIISALEWSINEITDNVLNHSQSESGGIVQISTFPQNHFISFAVADSGIGILNSLKESFPQLNSDIIALGEAIKSGVTRNNKYGQGNGLAGTLRIANHTGGNFSIISGKGKMHYFENDVKRDTFTDISFNGTIVSAEIRDNNENFSLEKALEFDGFKSMHSNIIEMNYLSDDCNCFSFVVKNESTGFGNRVVGRLLRRKLNNIINTEKGIPIIIDWSGIPIISSSFADEFVGKLFLELGPLLFSSKIRNIGMEPIIHGLLDKAISQRLTQANDDI